MIYCHKNIERDLQLKVDVCIVGSGAGGSAAAWKLINWKKKLKVLLLEAGEFLTLKDFSQLEHEMIPRLFHESGGRTNRDGSIYIYQGKGVGGSTLHNLNLCKRLPPEIFSEWKKKYNLKYLSRERLSSLYSFLEKKLSVSKIDYSQLNANNRLFKIGVERLHYRGGYLYHNRVGCVGSGFCELGCAYDAKQNGLKVFIAPAVRSGLNVITDCWATRLFWRNGVVYELEAAIRNPRDGSIRNYLSVQAKVFCISASATSTAALLLRSRVPDPYNLVGSRLFLHPGSFVVGLFSQPVRSWEGIPQGFESTQFLDFSAGSKNRVWLLPAFVHPASAASIFGTFGEAHKKYFQKYPYMAACAAMLHDETAGSVEPDGLFGLKVNYWLDASDREQMKRGIIECAKILNAAGAQKVIVPTVPPIELPRGTPLEKVLESLEIAPHSINITAVHPMGTVWMGDSERDSCTDSRGKYHHLENLFIADTSLFPSSIGIPPQLSTYAMGLHVAENILEHLESSISLSRGDK